MAVPRNRHSNARKNTRRSHHAKKPKCFSVCQNCATPKLSHVVCSSCGWYAGKALFAEKN